jgi:tetratricopeptide (TPR) repeat protein
VIVVLSALILVVWNVNVLYANNRHYWGANYFVNDLPEEALASFRKSLNAPFNPYVNATRRDFGDLVTQMYVQNKLPEPEKNLPWAVSEVDKAIGEDPNDYYLYLTLADMTVNFYELNPGQLLAVGQAAIDKAIELSNRQQNYYVKAKLHLILNEDNEAVAAMDKAVSLDPEIGDPHFYYALTLLELGDTEKGFAELKTAEELGRLPNTAEEARAVANYYGDAQRWEESVFWYKIAITRESSDNEARLKLGLVYYMSGRRGLAKEEISKVMGKTDLKNSPAYELLLPILQDLGL